MKRKILPAFFCVFLHITLHSFGQANEKALAQQANVLLDDAYNKGMFSGIVAISHNGEKIFSKAIGFADYRTKKTIATNTIFNIGSLNKKFTQEIIKQLVDEKKLSYDDKLSKYLNLYPTGMGTNITIRQLVDMEAGLGDFLQDPGYFTNLRVKDFSLTELVEVIGKAPLLFEPGTRRAYSNSGYAVLGAVIEKITGKSYQQNLAERISKPLGLKNIYYSKTEIEKQNSRAYATLVDLEGNKTSSDEVANSTPAGGIYSTIGDLLKFTEAKLLHPPAQTERSDPPLFAGGSPGWSSAISYNEKTGFVIAVLANAGDDIAVKITRRLNSIINNEPFPPLEQSLKMIVYKMINEKGYDYIKKNAENLAAQHRLPYDDHFLNDIANEFVMANEPDVAINIYKINLQLFPSSVFTYDVLARTYLKTGNKNSALDYFKKALALDGDNQEIKKMVEELQGDK